MFNPISSGDGPKRLSNYSSFNSQKVCYQIVFCEGLSKPTDYQDDRSNGILTHCPMTDEKSNQISECMSD